jgi:hypothetical protein
MELKFLLLALPICLYRKGLGGDFFSLIFFLSRMNSYIPSMYSINVFRNQVESCFVCWRLVCFPLVDEIHWWKLYLWMHHLHKKNIWKLLYFRVMSVGLNRIRWFFFCMCSIFIQNCKNVVRKTCVMIAQFLISAPLTPLGGKRTET